MEESTQRLLARRSMQAHGTSLPGVRYSPLRWTESVRRSPAFEAGHRKTPSPKGRGVLDRSYALSLRRLDEAAQASSTHVCLHRDPGKHDGGSPDIRLEGPVLLGRATGPPGRNVAGDGPAVGRSFVAQVALSSHCD